MHINIHELERLVHEEIRKNKYADKVHVPQKKTEGKLGKMVRLLCLALLFFALGRFSA